VAASALRGTAYGRCSSGRIPSSACAPGWSNTPFYRTGAHSSYWSLLAKVFGAEPVLRLLQIATGLPECSLRLDAHRRDICCSRTAIVTPLPIRLEAVTAVESRLCHRVSRIFFILPIPSHARPYVRVWFGGWIGMEVTTIWRSLVPRERYCLGVVVRLARPIRNGAGATRWGGV